MEVFLEDINRCLDVLHNGGLILYPTDTVWGIGCDATNEDAVAKIYQLKQRIDTKKMIVLMASERQVLQYATQIDLEIFNYLNTVTKPTTVIYEGVIGLADNLLDTNNSVAIRICEDQFCKHLLKRFQKPLVSTSANISGDKTPALYRDINEEIIKGVDYVVSYRREDTTTQEPSTIISWEKDGSISILRP